MERTVRFGIWTFLSVALLAVAADMPRAGLSGPPRCSTTRATILAPSPAATRSNTAHGPEHLFGGRPHRVRQRDLRLPTSAEVPARGGRRLEGRGHRRSHQYGELPGAEGRDGQGEVRPAVRGRSPAFHPLLHSHQHRLRTPAWSTCGPRKAARQSSGWSSATPRPPTGASAQVESANSSITGKVTSGGTISPAAACIPTI